MTIEQERAIRNARGLMKSARYALDDAMYGDVEHPLTDAEFKKIREAYDKICEATDLL